MWEFQPKHRRKDENCFITADNTDAAVFESVAKVKRTELKR